MYVGIDAPYLHFELVAEKFDLPIDDTARASTQDAPEHGHGTKAILATTPSFSGGDVTLETNEWSRQ